MSVRHPSRAPRGHSRLRRYLNGSLLGGALATTACATTAGAAVLAGPVVNPANGHSYYLLSLNNWTGSQSESVSLGGNLATINDAAENAWVFSTFASFGGVQRNLW